MKGRWEIFLYRVDGANNVEPLILFISPEQEPLQPLK